MVVLAFALLGMILAFPDKRVQWFPALKEYQVKVDFNELARIREIAIRNYIAAYRVRQPDKTIASAGISPDSTETSESEPLSENKNSTEEIASSSDVSQTGQIEPAPEDNLPDAPPDLTTYPPGAAIALSPMTLPDLAPPVFTPPELPPRKGKPIKFVKATLKGVPFYQATVDLKDPQMYLSIDLANDAPEANSATATHGDESFQSFVKRTKAAVVQNGTFFSKDNQKRVMGNMVARGRYLKYSRWENYGTTLGLKRNNEPEMITARIDGQPDWSQHWFSITCGPRLLRDGKIEIHATEEGFTDSHVLGVGPRCAMGFPASKDKIYIVTFLKGMSLQKEAEVMQAMGCSEAMNLDGGASRAIAHDGDIVVPASRALTNVIVVYDTKFPAPQNVIASWKEFQRRPDQVAMVKAAR